MKKNSYKYYFGTFVNISLNIKNILKIYTFVFLNNVEKLLSLFKK